MCYIWGVACVSHVLVHDFGIMSNLAMCPKRVRHNFSAKLSVLLKMGLYDTPWIMAIGLLPFGFKSLKTETPFASFLELLKQPSSEWYLNTQGPRPTQPRRTQLSRIQLKYKYIIKITQPQYVATLQGTEIARILQS